MAVGPGGGLVLPGIHDEGLANRAPAMVPEQDRGSGIGGRSDRPYSHIVTGPTPLTISGVTRDANGNALPNCVVQMFAVGGGGVGPLGDTEVGTTTSDGSGNFSLPYAWPEYTYYLVSYLAGSPDVAGTTVNTLVGS